MATSTRTVCERALSAEAIRDVCARPAVLLELGAAVPSGAVTCAADRRRAVADGVARALELALALEERGEVARTDLPLLEEAERRMWEPVSVEVARVLQRTGPDGLFAYLVVDGATRREAWRADTQRRRAERSEELPLDAATDVARDPVDLAVFRDEVERTVAWTAQRTGLSDELAYGIITSEVSYAEAGRRSGRTANGVWMAMARLRPEWQGLAARGRAAGLGGGVLVRVTDRTELAVRRLIRWRLIGGVLAGLLLAGTMGAAIGAAWLDGSASAPRAPVEPAFEASPPSGEGPYGPIGRILAIEAAARLLGDRTALPPAARPAAPRRATSAATRSPAAPPVSDASAGATGSGAQADSCGLGSAALACR